MKYNQKEKPFKSLTEIIIVIVLAAALLFVSFVVSLSKFSNNGDDSSDVPSTSEPQVIVSVPDIEIESDSGEHDDINYVYYDKIKFEKTAFQNSDVYRGTLAIINSGSDNFPAADLDKLVTVHSSRTGNYGLRDYSLKLNGDAMYNIDRFIMSFYDNFSNNGLGLTEAYSGTAAVGNEDLMSSYSVKFTTYNTSNTLSSPNFVYLKEQAYRYGIIQRYPSAKTAHTGYEESLSIYRYVGLAHSCYMSHYNLCLEEYIDKIKTEKVIEYKNPLEENAAYVIYYIEKDDTSDITYLDLPSGDEYQYEISGDGSDGFIITVKIS